jgi:hypothetical protein
MDGPLTRGIVPNVAPNHLDVPAHSLKALGISSRTIVEHPYGGSAFDQELYHVGTDEPSAPGDEDLRIAKICQRTHALTTFG